MFKRTKNKHLHGVQGAYDRIKTLVQDLASAGRIEALSCDLRGNRCWVNVVKDGNSYEYEFDHEDHEPAVVNMIYQDLYPYGDGTVSADRFMIDGVPGPANA